MEILSPYFASVFSKNRVFASLEQLWCNDASVGDLSEHLCINCSNPEEVLKCQMAVGNQTFLSSERGRKEDLQSI